MRDTAEKGRLAGRVALVVGAGSVGPGWGNGKATAVAFAREGARVLAADRNLSAAIETRDIIRGEGGLCEAVEADVTDAGSMAAMAAACVEAFGSIDILHNNVGLAQVGGVTDTDPADWDRILKVNITGMFLSCRAVVPHMERQIETGGSPCAIVNVGAIAGRRWTGVPMLAYAVSKAGVEALTRSIALQYARAGIRCNCILPGLMDTPHVVEPLKNLYGENSLERLRQVRNNQAPMGFMGTAWDVAAAAVYLASDDARYVNGHALAVDGGQSAQTWSPLYASPGEPQ
ncbi:NAD(P)-dependent dehydrogenase (short-subunit alcohol dehydrogenase family) [Chelatococcus asaccharovorans]|uniref:NAD(P)-dependent dehydrogenase (Short-subunit alcohol dehydrogenase family) n=2 Tax=Chelatococcus asaccharovorans TaxID=28210 RepID=A0A2V3TW35_9HYPH|nr:SDR family oxidoreductase [Chelatococcus asaccharovorans]PXW52554.1 NAD(P)-dependent dehydrogenase (short-subunit alcohol dehydrogenase family) [Chelatococcus asaccharovorans]